ncbi:hypothetical protein [Gelidibacter gilvus]|uniref:Lipoprotein n=1 Tax=Gelidibacter gilvus TaxID=59602 RepID=A0A4V1LN54_9FLAO|nr:hypothetical protein [Gelidibacter gilvus]RXJ51096.1 hypothetical protein ESZ48_04255 [Gelidibacter gilvus]
MKLIKTIFSVCSLFMLMSCLEHDTNKSVDTASNVNKRTSVNLNIIITPDLSNRVQDNLYPKPVKDIDLISSVFSNYYPTLYEYKHRISKQKDAINLDFTNSNIINDYDYKGVYSFDIYKKEEQNSAYLKTFDGTQTQFEKESKNFINDINTIYDKASKKPAGADIFSYFKKLNTIIKKDILDVEVQNYSIDTKYRNILILFTDGYLEAGLYGERNCIDNKCYFLDGKLISKFRDDFNRNGKGRDLKTFFKEKEYGIIPVENPNLKNVEIFVCELYDRSLDTRSGSQRLIPTDFDIMKIFWQDWLEESGFKNIKIEAKVNSVDEFQTHLMAFINE